MWRYTDDQLDTHPGDDHESAVDEQWIPLTIDNNVPITRRIITMPRIPPVNTTHSFGDMATATRIESIAKTRCSW